MSGTKSQHSKAVSMGMKRVWSRRGTICPCGKRYLRPTHNPEKNGYYQASRKNWDVCSKCDPTHYPGNQGLTNW